MVRPDKPARTPRTLSTIISHANSTFLFVMTFPPLLFSFYLNWPSASLSAMIKKPTKSNSIPTPTPAMVLAMVIAIALRSGLIGQSKRFVVMSAQMDTPMTITPPMDTNTTLKVLMVSPSFPPSSALVRLIP